MSILTYVFVWVFVMYMSVRMTIHISIAFLHIHVCTNDYSYYCVWFFVTHISVQMTIYLLLLNGISSCTCLYEWLSIFFWIGFPHVHVLGMTIRFFSKDFRHVHVCTNDYPFPCEWVFVMYIFERMTIHSFCMGFRHAYFCTDDYSFLFHGFSSYTFMNGWLPSHFDWIFVIYVSVRMTTFLFWMDFKNVHFCPNDYHFFLTRMSSFTFLYGWLPFSFWLDCCHAHFFTNDYHFFFNWFSSCTFCANDFPYSFWMDCRHVQ